MGALGPGSCFDQSGGGVVKVFYFGCPRGEKGHYWQDTAEPWKRQLVHDTLGSIDGVYPPCAGNNNAPQGYAEWIYVKGWTVLAYWDRSQDTRPGSNSAFAVKGYYYFDELLAAAKEQWPWVFERQEFEVVKYWEESEKKHGA